MSATITRGATVLRPTAVTSIRTERESRNIVHDIIARADADVSLRPAGLRSGTIELAYHSSPSAETDSELAEQQHALSGVFTITAPGRPSLSFTYVTAEGGRIARELNTETGVWTVRVDFQEVAP